MGSEHQRGGAPESLLGDLGDGEPPMEEEDEVWAKRVSLGWSMQRPGSPWYI